MARATCSVRLYVGSNLPDQPGKRISDATLRRTLTDLTSAEFVGATFTHTLGLWEGDLEESYIIEVFPSEGLDCAVLHQRGARLASALAKQLRQTSVMVISTGADGKIKQSFASGVG